MRRAATMSLPQVKQWAKSAVASVGPSGRSSRAASVEPSWPGKERRSVVMAAILACVSRHPGGRGAGPQHATRRASRDRGARSGRRGRLGRQGCLGGRRGRDVRALRTALLLAAALPLAGGTAGALHPAGDSLAVFRPHLALVLLAVGIAALGRGGRASSGPRPRSSPWRPSFRWHGRTSCRRPRGRSSSTKRTSRPRSPMSRTSPTTSRRRGPTPCSSRRSRPRTRRSSPSSRTPTRSTRAARRVGSGTRPCFRATPCGPGTGRCAHGTTVLRVGALSGPLWLASAHLRWPWPVGQAAQGRGPVAGAGRARRPGRFRRRLQHGAVVARRDGDRTRDGRSAREPGPGDPVDRRRASRRDRRRAGPRRGPDGAAPAPRLRPSRPPGAGKPLGGPQRPMRAASKG